MKCPICNTENTPEASNCHKCGFSLSLNAPVHPDFSAPQAPELADMLQLPEIELPSVPIERVLPENGSLERNIEGEKTERTAHKVEQATGETAESQLEVCSNCTHKVDEGSVFCSRCGYAFASPSQLQTEQARNPATTDPGRPAMKERWRPLPDLDYIVLWLIVSLLLLFGGFVTVGSYLYLLEVAPLCGPSILIFGSSIVLSLYFRERPKRTMIRESSLVTKAVVIERKARGIPAYKDFIRVGGGNFGNLIVGCLVELVVGLVLYGVVLVFYGLAHVVGWSKFTILIQFETLARSQVILRARVAWDVYQNLSPGTTINVKYATQNPQIAILVGHERA